MKTTTLIAGSGIFALSAMTFLPSLQAYVSYGAAASAALALWLVLRAAADQPATEEAPAPVAMPVAPPPPAAPVVRKDLEALRVLGLAHSVGHGRGARWRLA